MSNKARAYGMNAVWMHNKPPELIWHLKQFEAAEFHDTTFCEKDFLDNPTPPFFTGQELLVSMQVLCRPQPMYTDTELPPSLRSHIVSETTSSNTTPPSNGGGGGSGPPTTNATGRTGHTNTNTTEFRNTHLHPAFKAFWASVPKEKKRERLGQWLRTANSSTTAQLQALGVSDDKCGHMVIRGTCRNPKCPKDHTGIPTVPDAAAQHCVALLRQGANL